MIVRIHDLLEIDAQRFLAEHPLAPVWVTESLSATPFVVVRRGPAPQGEVAVGVRGEQRNQRWAGTCDPSWIRRFVTPDELTSSISLVLTSSTGGAPLMSARTSALEEPPALAWTVDTTQPWCAGPASLQSRSDTIPALSSLVLLARHESWKSLPYRWGPGGSVGFELATGRHTATSQSDLDLVVYADDRLSIEEAKHLHATTRNLPSAVDVRVETQVCGFSLAEYASCAPAPILLRKASGVVLGVDPWGDGSNTDTRRGEPAREAARAASEFSPGHTSRIDQPGPSSIDTRTSPR